MNKVERIKYLKLPFNFDVNLLNEDLKKVISFEWSDHFNKNGYEGSWTSVALYSANGEVNSIYIPAEPQELQETIVLKQCFYFKEVLSVFKAPIVSARLLNLKSESDIKPHKDYNLGYEDGCFRLHIPIITNDKVNFLLEGERVKMQPGECWYTNVNFTHSVSNFGETDRIHLVIDLERNEWTDDIFFSLASKEQLLAKELKILDIETVKLMISELENLDTPASKTLIAQLKKEHQI